MKYLFALSVALPLVLPSVGCVGTAEDTEDPKSGGPTAPGSGGSFANPGSGGSFANPGSGGSSTPNECAKMCEVEEVTTVVTPGAGFQCTAPTWEPGTGYPGASTVSHEGVEYIANYWTDLSPAESSGAAGTGTAWTEVAPCPGGGDLTEEVVTTKSVCCDDTTAPPNPTGCVLDGILGEDGFNSWFSSRRDPFYTYANLCAALEDFPDFANSSDPEIDKREVAAFFANVSRETGELQYIEQIVKDPPVYFGRGPIQLTWDYNYRAAGDALGIDLVGNPDLVASDGVVTWQTALWFWMEAGDAGKGLCHDAMLEGNFGQTINIINGGLECFAGNTAALERIAYYEDYCTRLGVDPGTRLTCW